jgi:hypothetical protein
MVNDLAHPSTLERVTEGTGRHRSLSKGIMPAL